jgi:quinol monooxygenase YgiN
MSSIRERAPALKSILAAALGFAALAAVSPADAQAPKADAIVGVTVLDVAPGARDKGVAILKQYREASRKQPGNLGVDVLQEIGHPNRFVVYETWTDQAAFDANEKATSSADLRASLKPIEGAPYDRRYYNVTTVGPTKPASGNDAVYLQVHLDVFPPGIDATIAAVKVLAEAARKGEGNLRFDVVRSVKAPTSHQTIYAAWQTRQAYDEFEASRDHHRFRDTIGRLLGSPYDDRLYTLVN